MDSLLDFEKNLTAEKAARELAEEKAARKDRKHKYHIRERSTDRDRRRHRGQEGGKDRRGNGRPHDHDSSEEGQRHKRSRRLKEDDGHGRRQRCRDGNARLGRDRSDGDADDGQIGDAKKHVALPDEEKAAEDHSRPLAPLVRDTWMTEPSAMEVDYIHRKSKKQSPAREQETRQLVHERELNTGLGNEGGTDKGDPDQPSKRDIKYTFGDEGSQWRMVKLKSVYATAEQTGRAVDAVAAERYGSLEDFDDAREEKMEMDRRKMYGDGYLGRDKPTGEIHKERLAKMNAQTQTRPPSRSKPPEQGLAVAEKAAMTQSDLNRLRAQLMKANLRNAPNAAELEEEYEAAMAAFHSGNSASRAVVLDASHNRMLAGPRAEVKVVTGKRGRERGLVEANEDMSIEDMMREERRTRGEAGGEGMRLAERIAKDGKFDNDLEYMDENAEKLARRLHRNEASLKDVAVSEYRKVNKMLDSCPLCHHEDRDPPQDLPVAPIISLATRVYLTLPTRPELESAEGGAVMVPINHRTNLLECDEDEWEEIRNFMKSLTRMYHDQGRDVLFYENAAAPHRRLHAALVVVPIPYDLGATAPAFFREAMLSADEEWAQHRKIIDTGKRARDGLGKTAFRRSIAKEMPYFHVWFDLDGGLGHVVEDAGKWPKGDLFAREIIGGMLDCDPSLIKKQGRWTRSDDRLDGFKKRWRKFDWTRVLTDE